MCFQKRLSDPTAPTRIEKQLTHGNVRYSAQLGRQNFKLWTMKMRVETVTCYFREGTTEDAAFRSVRCFWFPGCAEFI